MRLSPAFVCALLLRSSQQPRVESAVQHALIQFLQAGASVSLMVEEGKEGWEDRDSSIVLLPLGFVTGT